MKREHRILNRHRGSDFTQSSNHIVQDSLNRRNDLLEKYQTQMQQAQQIIQRKDRLSSHRKTVETPRNQKSLNKSRLSAHVKDINFSSVASPGLNDYQKLILGLQYSLQNERKKVEGLTIKNQSLQTEISNLRNLLVGPNEQKQYEKTVFKQYQAKIATLQDKIVEQKKNFQFIVDSKNQCLTNLQFQLRTLQKKMKQQEKQKGSAASKKLLELMASIEQLRNTLIKKNITIQRLKFHDKQKNDSQSEDQIQQKLISMNQMKKMQFYNEQLESSNKLIIRKNIEILNMNKKVVYLEEVLDVLEQYLDKKQVKNVDINILQNPAVNKLRILLREKAVFEKELLGQLNQHNKKISNFENQITNRDNVSGNKIIQVVNDNKRLTSLVTNLQNNIINLQKALDDQRRQSSILQNQIDINKKQFVQEIKKLKEELNTISSVTKNQFDRMKIENLKLSQQNRSLLFLVGEKEKQIHKKGQAIRTFEDYKEKINNLDISSPEKRKIQSVSEEQPQIGSKLILINTFSNWMMQWNKIKNWNNKKVLLNIILDKEQIQTDSLNSVNYLINVLHQSLLSSKNVEVQQRATILLSYYLKHNILKNVNLFVDKISPIIVRGLRPIISGEDQERHRVLNEASLKIISRLSSNQFKWTQDMTNQILSINGLKYIFSLIQKSQVDQLVESAYNCLILIAKANQMISFMNSYNITTIILNNLNHEYPFIIHLLHLLRTILQSRDYIKSQKSLLQFRKIFYVLKDEDEQTIDIALDCSLNLMQNSLFVKSLNKIQVISLISQTLRSVSQYNILKKLGEVYAIILTELETQNINKFLKQVDKLIDIIKGKKFNETRFNRTLRIILKISELISDSNDLDEKIINGVNNLYENYDQIEANSKVKLNMIINTIYERNKEVINKFSNETWINNLIQAYKSTTKNEEIVFLLKILQFQHEQKRTTQILRSGRQTFINKLINDSLIPDYNVALPALRNLLSISKQKYSQKFVNKNLFNKLVNKVLGSRNEEEFIGTGISVLYFFCKIEDVSSTVIDCGVVEKIFTIITERYDKETLIFKCLTLLELCHTTNYKKKILNYVLSHDANLQLLKTINFVLKKAKNKQQMGNRAVFLYDFLNGKVAVESLALLSQQNIWMIEDLISVRNEYVNIAESLVYKIEMLLHNMSTVNAKIRKAYEKFKVEGQYESQDDR